LISDLFHVRGDRRKKERTRELNLASTVANMIHVVAKQRTIVREDSILDFGVTWPQGSLYWSWKLYQEKKL